ncbi:complement factor H-like [Sebastes umbrosus]|uniref:complement factor H-like n=1 Tax=Sebastes umbrosus TaxID=72105 RepID=UPI00189F286A|nr:complement factor H-like [Sebastes umbrosus]
MTLGTPIRLQLGTNTERERQSSTTELASVRVLFVTAQLLVKMRLSFILLFLQLWGSVKVSLSQNAQQCPVILVGDNVQVIGDPEEATYGNVVRFSCKSNTEILSGSPEMSCDENGEWSGQPPKCNAIKCTVPMIENGEVPGDIQEYHEHDVLHFSCNPGYKRVEARLSKCTKRGLRAEWSPTPLCESVITCRLTQPPQGGTRYEPTSRSVFSHGDTVRVICGEKHWIVNQQDTSAVTTCKADGQWTIEPVCSEVRCSNRRPQFVHYWNVRSWERITLDETKTYNCRRGYKRTGGVERATCSRDGWKPDPLCQEITCKTQYYENSDIDGIDQQEYRYNARVEYVCNAGYEGRFTLTCGETGWIGSPGCTRIQCKKLHIDNAQINHNEKETYMYDENAQYACKNNSEIVFTITCGQSGWTGIQNCSDPAQQCPVILVGDNVQVIGDPEEATYGNVVRFSCKSNTEILSGSPEMSCDENGEWSGQPPKCDAIKCTVPMIENGEVPGDIQEYHEHDVLHFSCNPGYKRVEARLSKCTKRGLRAEWSPTPLCESVITCRLTQPPQGGTRYEPTSRSVFSHGDTVRVICGEKHWIVNQQDTSAVTTCKADGQWTIEPVCSEVRCSNQRPQFVYYWNVRLWDRITLGETKRYWCRRGYKRTGGADRATCSRDGWKPDPLCQAITCKTQYYQNSDIDGIDEQEYRVDARVEYVCRAGFEGRFTLTCRETGWTGDPRCTRIPCKKLHINNAQILRNEKETYSYNENAQYACKNNGERVFTITCGQSGWTGIQNCSGKNRKVQQITDMPA